MRFSCSSLGLALAVCVAGALPVLAQAPTLDPEAEAGKVIFEETAGGVGCALCHGMNATGDVEIGAPDIRGKDEVAILEQLRTNPDMQFIELTNDQVMQVATYLRYLHDLEAH